MLATVAVPPPSPFGDCYSAARSQRNMMIRTEQGTDMQHSTEPIYAHVCKKKSVVDAVQALELKYGGDGAHYAAAVIQRAFRAARLQKQFEQLMSLAMSSERLERRLSLLGPPSVPVPDHLANLDKVMQQAAQTLTHQRPSGPANRRCKSSGHLIRRAASMRAAHTDEIPPPCPPLRGEELYVTRDDLYSCPSRPRPPQRTVSFLAGSSLPRKVAHVQRMEEESASARHHQLQNCSDPNICHVKQQSSVSSASNLHHRSISSPAAAPAPCSPPFPPPPPPLSPTGEPLLPPPYVAPPVPQTVAAQQPQATPLPPPPPAFDSPDSCPEAINPPPPGFQNSPTSSPLQSQNLSMGAPFQSRDLPASPALQSQAPPTSAPFQANNVPALPALRPQAIPAGAPFHSNKIPTSPVFVKPAVPVYGNPLSLEKPPNSAPAGSNIRPPCDSASSSSSIDSGYGRSSYHSDAQHPSSPASSCTSPPAEGGRYQHVAAEPAHGQAKKQVRIQTPSTAAENAINNEQLDDDVFRRRQYRVGLNLFNADPELGMAYLSHRGFLDAHPAAAARFLLGRKGLSKKRVGEFLCTRPSLLERFLSELDFSGLHVDVALRQLQQELVLPGEAQRIDRVVEAFAKRYIACNQLFAAGFRSADTIFVLSYAIVMLNTDLHSRAVRPARRMRMRDFVRNLDGLDAGDDLDAEMLRGIYGRVKAAQFQPGSDHVTQVAKVEETVTSKGRHWRSLAEPHRRLVCFCRLTEIPDAELNGRDRVRAGAHQRGVFLFNDLMLVTKAVPKKKAMAASSSSASNHAFRFSMGLAALRINVFSTSQFPFGIQLQDRVSGKVMGTFNARSASDQQRFVADLQEAIAENVEMEKAKMFLSNGHRGAQESL